MIRHGVCRHDAVASFVEHGLPWRSFRMPRSASVSVGSSCSRAPSGQALRHAGDLREGVAELSAVRLRCRIDPARGGRAECERDGVVDVALQDVARPDQPAL